MSLATEFEKVGAILVQVREHAGRTQASLAKAIGSNTTRVFRIESGEVAPTDDEIGAYLRGLNTELALDSLSYLQAEWEDLNLRPVFPHPDWRSLQTIDRQLARIDVLKSDPETKAVFVRALELYAAELNRCAEFLQRVDHYLVFVGIISVGKTSAICTSVGLTLDSDELAFARRMVLEVGGGRITLCEVRVEAGPQYGLIVEPCTDEEVRLYVLDYADHLLAVSKQPEKPKLTEATKSPKKTKTRERSKPTSTEEVPWVSEEIARAIRGLSNLTEAEALLLAKSFPMRDELAIQILSKMDLLRRRETTIWYQDVDDSRQELEWLQRVFKAINNGRRASFSLPKRITVVVPRKLFDSHQISIGVIDTKGIDQASARADIDSHFDDPHAIVLLCTKFGEAPDLATMNLIRREMALHTDSNFDDRVVLLALPRNEEAKEMKDEARNDFVESPEAGYEVKLAHIRRALHPLGAENLPVRFLNATSKVDVDGFRSFVIEQFSLVRQHYVDRVAGVVYKLDELVEHRTTEERALAFEEVMQRLRVWTGKNTRLDDGKRPDELLVKEIGRIHPRTLWASVRREGGWDYFDYYYQLGYATRQIVASTAGERVKNLKAVIDNLAADPEYAIASEFLRQIEAHVDAAVDSLTRRAQVFGQTIYRDPLRSNSAYWSKCENVYGTGGPYRSVVASETQKWFGDATIGDLYRRLNEEVNRGWEELVRGLDEILEAPALSAVG